MSPESIVRWAWCKQTEALPPQAAVAWGPTVSALHARLSRMVASEQARLSVTANLDVMIVQGPAEALPWVPEIGYAAPCPDAPDIWLPTQWQPNVPCDLVAQALLNQFHRHPLLLWHQPTTVIPLDRVVPVSPAVLERIAQHHRQGELDATP